MGLDEVGGCPQGPDQSYGDGAWGLVGRFERSVREKCQPWSGRGRRGHCRQGAGRTGVAG